MAVYLFMDGGTCLPAWAHHQCSEPRLWWKFLQWGVQPTCPLSGEMQGIMLPFGSNPIHTHHVHPLSTNRINRIGMGTPSNHSRAHPILPASKSLWVSGCICCRRVATSARDAHAPHGRLSFCGSGQRTFEGISPLLLFVFDVIQVNIRQLRGGRDPAAIPFCL